MDKLDGYKTYIFFALTFLIGLAGLFGFYDWEPSAEQAEWLTVALSFAGLLLRTLTNKKVFWRK